MNFAATQSGFEEVRREWPSHGAWDGVYGGWHWFDVMGLMDGGERVVFDLEIGYRDSRPTAGEQTRYIAKIDFCSRHGWNYVIIARGLSSQEVGVRMRHVMREIRNARV